MTATSTAMRREVHGRLPVSESGNARRFLLGLVGLLAATLLPHAAAGQLLSNLPFDHQQFELEMISGNQLRLTGDVEIAGDGYDIYADQVDIRMETTGEAPEGVSRRAAPIDGSADSDSDDRMANDTPGDETPAPSLRLIASGNVVFSAPDVRITADRVEYWTDDQTAVFHEACGWIDPGDEVDRSMFGSQEPDMLFYGQMIERTGTRTYRITEGACTSCLQPTPRWQLVATSFTLNLDSYVLLLHAVLEVKGVPVFYLPGMFYPIQKDGRATGFLMPTYGASRHQGSSISNAFFWAIDRSQDATLYHDWFMRRGDGRGAEYPRTHDKQISQ